MGDKWLLAQLRDIPSFIEFCNLFLTFDFCLVAVSLSTLTKSVTEKGVNCRRLKDQLDTLERETTDKLAQMEQYHKELKVSENNSGYGVCLIIFCLDHLNSTKPRLLQDKPC